MSARMLSISSDGLVRRITIERPQAMNALNAALRAELLDAFTAASSDRRVRVIVLSGAGDKAFAAGADIPEMLDCPPDVAETLSQGVKRLHDAIRRCGKPVIAAINGYCLGGGLELALACDIRIAAENAKLGLPEIKLGIIPGGGGTARLARLAGPGWARRLVLTGEMIGAVEAKTIGLVSEVVPDAELPTAADRLARHLAGLSSLALAQAKCVLDAAAECSLDVAEALESKAFGLCFAGPDQKEGMQAFMEKRKPRFAEQ